MGTCQCFAPNPSDEEEWISNNVLQMSVKFTFEGMILNNVCVRILGTVVYNTNLGFRRPSLYKLWRTVFNRETKNSLGSKVIIE